MGIRAREIIGVDVDKLLKLLNAAYASEWLAYYQYWLGAKVIKGPMKDAVAAELLLHSTEELSHADTLANRIIQLSGTPVTDLLEIRGSARSTSCGLPTLLHDFNADAPAPRVEPESGALRSLAMSMKKVALIITTCGLLAAFAAGCFEPAQPDPPPNLGGLKSEDFELISLNGFDPADNAVDINDYAWAMDYFEPDGGAPAYVYVGTGNDMIGLIYQGISAVLGNAELGEVSARPPEVRRYRGDIFPYAWETVLDYRDVELDGQFQTIGFRFMQTYRSQADGVDHLYAATFGQQATVWRSPTGDRGSWQVFWQSDEPGSVRYMEEHGGLLYLAFVNEAPTGDSRVGKIFVTDGGQVTPVVTDGFGNPANLGIMCLASFNGWLYAGTQNETSGYEVWKLAGPDGANTPVPVVARGGPSAANFSAITACVFEGQLYIGSQLDPLSNLTLGLKAADIIRIDPDDTWETVVGPNSISGFDSGFDHWPNTYIWSMVVHEGWLYAATYDQVSPFFNVLENMDRVIKALTRSREANLIERWARAGSDLYKTQDGVTWYPVTLTGFGDVGNYGIRVMESVGEYLYVGTANPFDGLEVWRGRSHD